ncbi:hypothetical protein [Roseovarius salinarum]|uniref:hypothetical protein n=1 Tax=Roseovarius salinarum TaxID=1981892 RepID=UPI0013001070|nr:hypothetical protein [Roseovarius salinarum]
MSRRLDIVARAGLGLAAGGGIAGVLALGFAVVTPGHLVQAAALCLGAAAVAAMGLVATALATVQAAVIDHVIAQRASGPDAGGRVPGDAMTRRVVISGYRPPRASGADNATAAPRRRCHVKGMEIL